jgi:cytochrome c553
MTLRRFTPVVLGVALMTPLLSPAHASSTLAADASAGKQRAGTCFSCHNQNGVSTIPGLPTLAGQDRTYLIKALQEYRNGLRRSPTMSPTAHALSDADIAHIAAYFSSLPR